MLETLTLKNFRRHRDLTVDFTTGINAVRAPNEGGKSTLTEACAYALFGSKALRTTLEQTVTWGEDVKSLMVDLELTSGGIDYVFSRSKAGAEVIKGNTVFITGQNEVSTFAATLIGADQSIASNLMFSGQGNIRGALEEGPKALSSLIEDLAGFTVFDDILERAQEKLALGSPALLEERLKGAESTLAAATESLPVKPDDEAYQASVTAIANKMAEIESGIPELKRVADAAAEKFSAASQEFNANNVLVADIERAAAQVVQCEGQAAGFRANADKVAPDVEGLKAQLLESEQWDARHAAYQLFLQLNHSVERFEGTITEFILHKDKVSGEFKRNCDKLVEIDNAINAALRRRINHDKCDKCGQDVTHLTHVVETNVTVDAEVLKLKADRAVVSGEIDMLSPLMAELDAWQAAENQDARILAKLGGYVNIDNNSVPARVSWIGSDPGTAGPDTRAYRTALETAQAEVRVIEQAKAKLELVLGQLADAKQKHADLKAKLDAYTGPSAEDILRLQGEKNDAALAVTVADGNIIIARRELADLTTAHEAGVRMWNLAQARVSDAEKTIASTKADLESLSFNNALVKKLRAIRPIVANQVWNSVLTSVSVMFSQMRGEESWVTKDKGGFCVNGQAVESLSGSTLDILGVALRVALMKTFMPECSLLVLDEPAQGCDQVRTEALLGFIAASGIGQTVLITHEDVSESVADNLIEI